MSILSSTNSGLEQIPISIEGAIKMGWKIDEIKYIPVEGCKIYNLNRDDVPAPLQFWFEPENKLKFCKITLYFFADEEFFISDLNSHFRNIENLKQLNDCLQFLRYAKKCKKDMVELYSSKIGNLKNSNINYL